MNASAASSVLVACLLLSIGSLRAQDPCHPYKFKVVWDNTTEAEFSEVSGLGVEVDLVEYRDGSDPSIIHYLPGQVRYSHITLKKCFQPASDLWNWMRATADGDVQRRLLSIVVVDVETNTEVARWNCHECFPIKWTGPTLNGKGNEVAIEELVLATERLELE